MSNNILQLAEYIATNLVKTGSSIDEAIKNVAGSFTLTIRESSEIRERVKKAAPVVSEPVAEEQLTEEIPEVVGNSIKFTAEDLDTAVGVLMYKGIPWLSKNENSLTFDSPALVEQAKEALGRRWEFVNAQPRRVAMVEFDNLSDYQKVLEFMASKKMNAMVMESDNLEEDIELENSLNEQAFKKATKEAKISGQPAPEKQSQAMSYSAQRKDTAVDLSALDPIKEASARSIRITKRWK